MALKKEMIHGYWLISDESFRDGVRYLRDDLQKDEAGSLFEAAKLRGSSQFEDDYDRDWTLVYNRNDYTFTMLRRTKE